MEILTLVRSIFLYSRNLKNHPCKVSESIPTGTEPPKSFRATNLTASSVMSMGIKISVSSYVFNVEQEVFFSSGCFPARTYAVVSLKMPALSSTN